MDSIVFLVLRRMRAPLLTLIVVYALAVSGLVLIPGETPAGEPWHMSFFEALYFVGYTSTTIGFGELPHPFSAAQRLWVVLCIYATVIAWLYSIGAMIALLQDKALQRVIAERRFSRRVRRIGERFYLVCGYGQAGGGLVRALTDADERAVVLDSNAERIDLLKLEPLREFVPALHADVRRPDNLVLAGLRNPRCAGVLALTSSNEVNLKIAITAKLMHPGATVICRSDSHDVAANMASFGTDHIYDPFDSFARYLGRTIRLPCLTALDDWLNRLQPRLLPEPVFPPSDGLWVICGYGRFGKAVYHQLAAHGIETIVVEMEPERTGVPPGPLIKGRGTEAVTLQQAEIDRAVGLIAGTDDDANNLSIVMTARDLNPDLFTVVRENQIVNEELFAAVEADILMHPSLIVAQQIRSRLSNPLLDGLIRDAEDEPNDWACTLLSRIVALADERAPQLWEVRLGGHQSQVFARLKRGGATPRIAHLLCDPRNRDRPLPAIILTRRNQGTDTHLPDPNEPLELGDRLLVCGCRSANRWMQWTLHNPDALTYTVIGTMPARGLLWRWLQARTG